MVSYQWLIFRLIKHWIAHLLSIQWILGLATGLLPETMMMMDVKWRQCLTWPFGSGELKSCIFFFMHRLYMYFISASRPGRNNWGPIPTISNQKHFLLSKINFYYKISFCSSELLANHCDQKKNWENIS